MAGGGYHTGRTQRIREFLARNANEAFTAREVLNAIDPGDSIDLVAATLATMASSGKIARVGAGNGRVHYCWPRGMEKPDGRKARKQAKPRPAAAPKPKATATPARNPKPYRATPAAKALADALRSPAPRRVNTNFPAALATVDHGFDPRRDASHRIAADIAAFERSGGQVQRLGVTPLFQPIEPTVFDQEQP